MKWHITQVRGRVDNNHSIKVGKTEYLEGYDYVVYSHRHTDSMGTGYETLFQAKKGALERIEEMRQIAKEYEYKF